MKPVLTLILLHLALVLCQEAQNNIKVLTDLREGDVGTAGAVIRKCCNETDYLDLTSKECRPKSYHDTIWINKTVVPVKILTDIGTRKLVNNTVFKDSNLIVEGPGFHHCSNKLLIEYKGRIFLTPEGKFVSVFSDFDSGFDLGSFCIDLSLKNSNNSNEVVNVALVCDPCAAPNADGVHGSHRPICVRTYCPPNAASFINEKNQPQCYNISKNETNSPPLHWTPNFSPNKTMKRFEDFLVTRADTKKCPINRHNSGGGFVLFDNFTNYWILENSTLKVQDINGSYQFYPFGYYFVVLSNDTDDNKLEATSFLLCAFDDSICYACVIYPYCCTISNVFLVLTFIAYAVLPELHQPLFGKITMAFIVTLFAAYLTISINSFYGSALIGKVSCVVLGFAVQFFFLNAFFWMNVMSYDIYKKFRTTRIKTCNESSFSSKDRKKFVKYFIYATGMPIFIVGLTVAVEFLITKLDPNVTSSALATIKPKVGERTCFFDQDQTVSQFIFYYMPLLLIQIANIHFFLSTVVKLMMAHKNRKILRADCNYNNSLILVKVFLVMGINWLSELFSFLVKWGLGDEIATKVSYFNDMFNLLQGLLIFILLICKPSILKALKSRFSGNSYTISSPASSEGTKSATISEKSALDDKQQSLD